MIGPKYFELARGLYSSSDFEEVVRLLVSELPGLVGADEVLVTEWSPDAGLEGVWDHGPVSQRMRERIGEVNRLSQNHPLAALFRDMESDGLSLVVSECSSIEAYLDSEYGQGIYDGIEISDLMAGLLVRGHCRQAYVSCYRRRGNYSAQEKELFDAILLSMRSVMERIEARNVEARVRELQLLTKSESPMATFSLNAKGELLPMNHPAVGIADSNWPEEDAFRQLGEEEMKTIMKAAVGAWDNPVSPRWVDMELNLGQGPVKVHLLPSLNCEGVVMYPVGGEENFAEAMKGVLTKRQLEIMEWISEGKTSAETAIILEISPRTVEKHLEAVFQRFGVENRITAVRRYLDSKAGIP
ncbi:response regulator transcription factor [Haloferula sp.]|uniref:response regulator transcription factor n=1 Tax=Haloferula sp. TaxID=2497595 RepID=UPI003C737500